MFKLSDFRFPTIGRGLLLKGSAAFLIGITLAATLFGFSGLPSFIVPQTSFSGGLQKFSSYNELTTFLNESTYPSSYYYYSSGVRALAQGTFGAGNLAPSPPTSSEATADYSKTNIQVEGVDEADLVKNDGEYLYVLSNQTILIVKAYPAETAMILARIPLNGTFSGLYVNGNRLVIIENEQPVYPMYDVVGPYKRYYGGYGASVKVYDIGDRNYPILVRNVSVNGSYLDSRMIGNYAYAMFTTVAYLQGNSVSLPALVDNGKVHAIEAPSIYYSNVSDFSYSFTTIISINVQTNQEVVSKTLLVGYASSVYVSLDNIYVAIPKYHYGPITTADDLTEKTEIHRIRIENGEVEYEASGAVPGFVLNQFSMDEYNGYFRIATTINQYGGVFVGLVPGQDSFTRSTSTESLSRSQVYVLNMSLATVGSVTDLAPGERIYSARFMGTRCYLVTFQKIDPLFVIGLDNPTEPKVLGKLKIPGYSDYLQPYDETHLIGIGKWTVESEEGDFAWYQGVKISIFDVSDVAHPREVANFSIGDRGTDSPVLQDHKALLFDKEKNLLAIPVTLAKIDTTQYSDGQVVRPGEPGASNQSKSSEVMTQEVPPYAYGDYVWQGLYVFRVTENSITLRGNITHIEDPSVFLKSGYYYSSDYSVERSLYIGNVLYTISNRMIKMNDLTTLEPINEIQLS
jgi:uncharacterized secreted protein with C-terminal beta-propeller domain